MAAATEAARFTRGRARCSHRTRTGRELMNMKLDARDVKDKRDDDRGGGAERPDLVLVGEEEHPLSPWVLELDVDKDTPGK